jgi:serine/threonine protein kinase
MAIPDRIGSFEIVDKLGEGGMGVVYRARQPRMDREVALKELSLGARGRSDWAERFLQEARLGGSLGHPNIVVVHDYFEHEGSAYIAMEYLPRGSLAPQIPVLTLPQSVGVLEAVLAGLSHAGAHGVVHRDLKPANLLISGDGRIKIADFGIAKALDATTALNLTATRETLGTPAYMAPEQTKAEAVDPRADLYSLGVIAYEMFAKQPPFDASLPWPALMFQHVYERPRSPSDVNPDVPAAIAQWIEWMMAKEPGDRPADARAAWTQLEEIAVGLLSWRWRREAGLGVGGEAAPAESSFSTIDASTTSPPHPPPSADEPYSLRVPARRRPRVGSVLPRGELRSPRPDVREAAIPRLSAVLRSSTDPEIADEARRALRQLAEDPDPKVAAAAKRALELSD